MSPQKPDFLSYRHFSLPTIGLPKKPWGKHQRVETTFMPKMYRTSWISGNASVSSGSSYGDMSPNDTPGASFSTISPRQTSMFQFGVTNSSLSDHGYRFTKRRRRKRYPVSPEVSGNVYPVSAVHVAQTIDLFPLVRTVFAKDTLRKAQYGKNVMVVQLAPIADPNEAPRFVAIFRFGSVVTFNVSPKEAAAMMQVIRKHTKDAELSGFERKEHFGVMIRDDTNATYFDYNEHGDAPLPVVTGDYCVLPTLDMDAVAVIGNILGQSVALDSISDHVDDLLNQFTKINSSVHRKGKFSSTDKNVLFQVIAKNNSISIDMISKVRLKDRSDTAWNLTKLERIHSGLKEEFEIEDRSSNVEFKLDLIQQNAKFFLEVLQHQKSNSLEWIIVVLITVECFIMVADMSGYGETLVAAIVNLISSLQ